MSDYQKLKQRLRDMPYLAADAKTGNVELIDQVQAFRIMAKEGPFTTKATIQVANALEHFARVKSVGEDDREFSLKEISEIMGVSYFLAYNYIQREIITPSVRDFGGSGQGDCEAKFSWGDAFIAGVVGCLRRNGIKPKTLAKVQALFTEKKKQADKKVATSCQP